MVTRVVHEYHTHTHIDRVSHMCTYEIWKERKRRRKGLRQRQTDEASSNDVYEIRLDDVLWARGREARDGAHTAGT